jgi:hypothetical protein
VPTPDDEGSSVEQRWVEGAGGGEHFTGDDQPKFAGQ